MSSTFDILIPTNLTFQDYLAICQTSRIWADGYDLKSHPHLLATLAPTVTIDYSLLVPDWSSKTYSATAFADLWLSPEHLGLGPLATQHLLGAAYFESVGRSSSTDSGNGVGEGSEEVNEVVVSWQILASHGRRRKPADGKEGYEGPMTPVTESSDHRSFVRLRFVKVEVEVDGKENGKKEKRWRIAMIQPSVNYIQGEDFMRVRRAEGVD